MNVNDFRTRCAGDLILANTLVEIHKTLITRQKTQWQSLCDKIIKKKIQQKI